jgi:pimeloyl-ACP methyl ester carboxylesterase
MPDSETALMHAVRARSLATVRVLIAHHADPQAIARPGGLMTSVMGLALEGGDTAIIGVVGRAIPRQTSVRAQQPPGQFEVRRDSVEWSDSVTTRATIWTPVGLQGDLPTLIFSPGFGQAPAQYTSLLAQWARHGYLVIGIAHPPFRDPDAVELYDAAQVIAHHLVRSVDHILLERQHGRAPFTQVDRRRLGLVGHSVGGAAAAQACAWDPRPRAGMDLDGTLFGPVLHTGMRQPFFLLRQDFELSERDRPRFLEHNDQANLHEDSVFAHTSTMYWLTVVGLNHLAFTDLALTPTAAERAQVAAGLRLSADRTQQMTTQYVLDFFGVYLSGAPRPASLDRSPFPKTTLRHQP